MIRLTGTVVTAAGDQSEAWIDGGVVSYEPRPGAATEISGFAFPGLVDSHCHIGIGKDGIRTDRQEALADARTVLATGVTRVRDLGVHQDMRWIDSVPMTPIITHCGRHVARPKRYLRGYAREIEPGQLPQVLAEEAERSDGWVKLVGDWIDRSMGADADLVPLWPREILVDAVAAAHEAGARVAVHTFATETIDDLLAAGVDDIEHGTGMTPDQMDEVARRGILVSPTVNQIGQFQAISAQAGTKYPVYAEHMARMWRNRFDQAAAFADAGITLLMGSDTGGTLDFGSFPSELVACVEAGIPAPTVMAAASWGGRAALGFDGLGEGEPADVVVYDEDPRTSIRTVLEPAAVIRGGELVSGATY